MPREEGEEAMKRLTKEEKATLSPEILRDYPRWADPKCDGVIRVRALLEIHEFFDKPTSAFPHGRCAEEEIKRILGRK